MKTGSSKEFLFGQEVKWETVATGLKRQVLGYDGSIMMVKVDFAKGAVGDLHSHLHSQVTYVERGEFEMIIGDEKKILRAGDSFYVPPHVTHGCVCREDGVLIDVFSPVRMDFLSSSEPLL